MGREQLPVIPETANVITRSLRLTVLDMGLDFSDFKLGNLVVWAPMVFVDQSSRFFHPTTRGEPSGGFRHEEATKKDQGWRDDLESQS